MKARITEWKETLSVKWFMLDAQQKQAAIFLAIALWEGAIELVVAKLKGNHASPTES